MSPPWVCFRTSGGKRAGFGHLRRCITLATTLGSLGVESTFILDGDSAVHAPVKQAGFEATVLATGMRLAEDVRSTAERSAARGARAIVVDSYRFGTEDFAGLRAAGLPIVAIDDLADRALPVDVVVNGAAWVTERDYSESDYSEDTGETGYAGSAGFAGTAGSLPATLLLGPKYALLRPEFAGGGDDPAARRSAQLRRVLITLGGSDPFDLTPRLVEWTCAALASPACSALPAIDIIDVVVGPLFGTGSANSVGDADAADNAATAAFRRYGGRLRVHHNPPDMCCLMRAADIAICGGGQTTYELAASGTPAIAIQMASNQARSLRALADAGTLVYAGEAQDPNLEANVTHALGRLAAAPDARIEMGKRGRALVDGKGTWRVARAIADLIGSP